MPMTTASRDAHALIVVQNLPVPFDRRVWLECQALRGDGYEVSVVCPKGSGDPSMEVLDGVTLYKYRPYQGGGAGAVGFIVEYLYSFAATAWLTAKAWRRRRFQVLQACNPPDIFWPIGLFFRFFGGARFVFDQHDLCPELFESRFPDGARGVYRALRALEWCTFKSADRVISTNESYREVATRRGGKREDQVTVVRTGPDAQRLRRGEAEAQLRRGRRYLVAYIGVMGPQDGVDIVVRAASTLVGDLGRQDISFTLMGSGDCFEELVALRDSLGLQDVVEFTGRAPDELVSRVMSTADVGLSPDPKNPLNDISTMNKTMEYMAFGLPTVAFDLKETRVSAGDAAVYAVPNETEDFARAIADLLDDEPLRQKMAVIARSRVEEELAWEHQRSAYVGVYRQLLGARSTAGDFAATDPSPLAD
ncbi:MAG: glycosyltransferase family 4 protein [Acidimicrobiales bacterium]